MAAILRKSENQKHSQCTNLCTDFILKLLLLNNLKELYVSKHLRQTSQTEIHLLNREDLLNYKSKLNLISFYRLLSRGVRKGNPNFSKSTVISEIRYLQISKCRQVSKISS